MISHLSFQQYTLQIAAEHRVSGTKNSVAKLNHTRGLYGVYKIKLIRYNLCSR